MRQSPLLLGLGLTFGVGAGCLPLGTYACGSDDNCRRDGEAGICAQGYCAYPDVECGEGYRYDDLATDDLAGQCVGEVAATDATSMATSSTTNPASTSMGSSSGAETDATGDPGCEDPNCTDWDGDGHCAEASTEEPDCDDANPSRWQGCKYLSPTGDDANSGTSPAQAWLTFAAAMSQLQPGDSLVLVDGEYTVDTTGLPDIVCGLGGVSVGTAAAPISIAAQSERAATLVSDGLRPALRLDGCSYWNVSGIHAMATDTPHDPALTPEGTYLVHIRNSDHNVVRRALATHPNRYILTALLRFDAVIDSLVEETEFYFYNHNALELQAATNVTLRRLYANSKGYPDLPDCSTAPPDFTVPRCSANPAAGGTAFTIGGSDLLVENCASRNHATAGFSLTGERGRLLGALSSQDGTGILVAGWTDGSIENALVVRSISNGINLNAAGGVAQTTLRNCTVLGSEGNGFRNYSADLGCAGLPDGCGTSGVNLLALDNLASGVLSIGPGAELWTVRKSVLAGNTLDVAPSEPYDDGKGVVRNSSVDHPADIGLESGQCMVFIPEDSVLHGAGAGGADIGANLLYRYRDGVLTGVPLWDPQTDEFPCGAIKEGINDDGFESCSGLGQWFSVGDAGCMLPTTGEPQCP